MCDTADQIFGSSSAAVTRYAGKISSLLISSLAQMHDSKEEFRHMLVTIISLECNAEMVRCRVPMQCHAVPLHSSVRSENFNSVTLAGHCPTFVCIPSLDLVSDSCVPMPTTIPTVLTMPATAVACLLPSPSLSILGFLEFVLPPPTGPIIPSKNHAPPSAYFSFDQPNIEDIQVIKAIPVPPPDVIDTLLCHAATLTSTVYSVQCIHLIHPMATSYRLPLWIISYWLEVSHLRDTIRPPWVTVEQILKQRGHSWRKADAKNDHELVQQAYMMLGSLSWTGYTLGFKTHEKIHYLSTYMTHEWLSDVHEMQMLKLLQIAICQQKASIEIEIEGPFFHGYLKSASEAGELRYKDSASFSRARGLGKALQSGQRTSVGFITNVNGNHWIATIIDFAEHRILYGDSLGREPNDKFVSPVQWWVQHHSGTQFSITELPTPLQQDSFSCGILAFSALTHFYLPDQYPLMDARLVDEERMKIFLEVGRHHLKHLVSRSFCFRVQETHLLRPQPIHLSSSMTSAT